MDKFTKNQQLAIDTRDCNVLVSAAAGSGKTSVLVERIIGRITDPADSVDVDRLLVMTFTNAAAVEMKSRIRQALEERLDEARKDGTQSDRIANLERQSILVHNALITTIHGFCKSVITDNFEKISLDPTFRVADENECRLMRQDALDECLEAAYCEADPAFLAAVESFSTGKNDGGIAELVIPLHSFIMADPEPEKFVKECLKNYEFGTYEEFERSPMMKIFEDFLSEEISKIADVIDNGITLIDENEGLEAYRATMEAYRDGLKSLIGNAKDADTSNSKEHGTEHFFDAVRGTLSSLSIPAFGRIMDKNLDDSAREAKNTVKNLRDEAKARIEELQEYLTFDLKTTYMHISESREALCGLCDLVLAFGREYDRMKRDRNVIDFNDMEHMAIRILKDPKVSEVYRQHFDEIYIDEYQDSNLAQERLVQLICRHDPGNVFQVGDVKQSIYRFRQARPDLFLTKYNTYKDEDGSNRRILLNDNFRSRSEVVYAVNEVFSAIMKKDLGAIEYDEDAALKFGATCYTNDKPCDGGSYKAEIVVGIKGDLSSEEMEADIIADRIRSMIDEGFMVYDKGAKKMRPASYRDFTILVRSIRKFEPVFRKVFASCGLPLSVTGREGYFDTVEIRTVIAFLSAVDNSLCDIPLAAVAKSPVGGFSDRDLARLTARFKEEKCLYERMKACAETGTLTEEENPESGREEPKSDEISDKLREKCIALLELLDKYRVMSTYTPVHSLITSFIDNEYGDYVKCMSNPAQRMANIRMLLTKAEDYGKTSFKGLYQFVRYMDQIRKYSIDDGEASIVGENDDVVRIMTMHASKGLEFPVVFLAGIEKRRNTMDESGKVLWSTAVGIGCDHIDLKRRTVSPTLPKLIVKRVNREEGIAEEIRVLYVAMTRAREKLIMVACDREDTFERPAKDISSCLSYLDMLKVALTNGGYDNIDISFKNEEDLVEARFEDTMESESAADEIFEIVRRSSDERLSKEEGELASKKDGDVEGDPKCNIESTDKTDNTDSTDSTGKKISKNTPECMQYVSFTYPHPINPDLKAKLSVSELKHRAIEEEIARGMDLVPEGEQLFSETELDKYIPKFMRSEGETATGATFFGTAFHRIMELWDYPQDKDNVEADDVTRFAAKMHELRRMDKDQVDAIRPNDVVKFLNSNLGTRMRKAKAGKNLFREQPFVIGVPQDGETVLVQGIIDAYFIEDDGITIVDYKTDRVDNDEMLINRYRTQLEYYGAALSQITGKKIKALVIYSTCLGREIIIPERSE